MRLLIQIVALHATDSSHPVDPTVTRMQSNGVMSLAHFVLRHQDPNRLQARKPNVGARLVVADHFDAIGVLKYAIGLTAAA